MALPGTCTNCGHDFQPDDRFCESCGSPRVASTPADGGAAGVRKDASAAVGVAGDSEASPPPQRAGGQIAVKLRTPPSFGGADAAPLAGNASAASAWAALLERVRNATIGRYEVLNEIGRGGMAAVYLANDLRLGRRVALKVMLPTLSFIEGMAERFREEARTAAKLDHPNIVVIYSVDETSDLLFFAMKYIDGCSLDELLRQGMRLPMQIVQMLLVQIASALHFAHTEGVIHRDVKPGNVMLDRRGTAVVTDFGIAKASESPTLTLTGSLVGTPAYLSPEVCKGERAIAASDQYSFGVMAYELLAGARPFDGSLLDLQVAHLSKTPRPLTDLCPDLPRPLADAVMRMLAKPASARWPSLEDAIPALAAGLPHDTEPVRRRLVELARLGGTREVRDGVPATPVSPIVTASPRSNVLAPPAEMRTAPIPEPQMTPEVEAVADERDEGEDLVPVIDAPPPPSAVEPIPEPIPEAVSEQTRDANRATVVDMSAYASPRTPVPETPPPTPPAEPPRQPASEAELATVVAPRVTPPPPSRPSATPAVASLRIGPTPQTLAVGESFEAVIAALDASGEPLERRPIAWSSSDDRVAIVSAVGKVTAVGAGTVTVIARSGSATSVFELSVPAPAVVAIELSVPRTPLTVGARVRFTAILRDARGTRRAATNAEWTSSDPTIATIESGGIVVAHRSGVVLISAAASGVSASIRLTVHKPSGAAPTPPESRPPELPPRAVRGAPSARALLIGGALVVFVIVVMLIVRAL